MDDDYNSRYDEHGRPIKGRSKVKSNFWLPIILIVVVLIGFGVFYFFNYYVPTLSRPEYLMWESVWRNFSRFGDSLVFLLIIPFIIYVNLKFKGKSFNFDELREDGKKDVGGEDDLDEELEYDEKKADELIEKANK